MFEIMGSFITGCMVGIEFIGGQDVGSEDISFGCIIDLFIIRLQFVFFKSFPGGMA